jgi:hypothetical protein
LNYLVIEGFKDAAEQFCNETGLNPGMDLSSIQDRMLIRNAIEDGNIQEAIERANDLDAEVRARNIYISFYITSTSQRILNLIS